MERLTHERANGIRNGYWSPNKKQELVDKLAEYENTGLTPEEIMDGKMLTGLIPVEERLPDNPEELVLIQVSGQPRINITLEDAFELATYNGDDGWVLEVYPEWSNAHPVAWQPLPEPYTTNEGEEE